MNLTSSLVLALDVREQLLELGPSNSATARSYFSIAQLQKSKSSSETPSWIEPQSVQPYFDIRPQSRARATLLRSGRP